MKMVTGLEIPLPSGVGLSKVWQLKKNPAEIGHGDGHGGICTYSTMKPGNQIL
jgi:hypothetical protein